MADPPDTDRDLSQPLGDRLFLALYFGSHKIPAAICFALRAAETGIQSLVVGIWLGFLTPRLMQKLDIWYYTRGFAMYRDKDYNRSGWFDWEREAIDTYFSRVSSVLVAAGAGAGREMLALRRMGIPVDGFEYNPALLRLGNTLLSEDGWAPSIYPGAPNELPPGAKQYDGAIIGWATYTLIEGSASRTSLLKQVRSRCASGSPILLSFFHRSGNTLSFRMTARVANSIRTLLRRPKVEMGDTLSVSYAHRFTEQEISEELTTSGFQPVLFKSEPYGHAVGIAV